MTEFQVGWKDAVDRHRLRCGKGWQGGGSCSREKVVSGPGLGPFLLLGPGYHAAGNCRGPGGHPGPGAEKDSDLEAAAAAGREWDTLRGEPVRAAGAVRTGSRGGSMAGWVPVFLQDGT